MNRTADNKHTNSRAYWYMLALAVVIGIVVYVIQRFEPQPFARVEVKAAQNLRVPAVGRVNGSDIVPITAGLTVNVVSLGVDPLGNVPCSDIIQQAVDDLSIAILQFPANPKRSDGALGFYWFDKKVTITRALRIEGLGTGSLASSDRDPAARIRCNYGVGAFYLPGPGNTTNNYWAAGAYISHLQLSAYGPSPNDPVKVSHGIESHIQIHLCDLRIQTFSGHGIFLDSSDGNVSRSSTDNIFLVSNGMDGIYVRGNDANACLFRTVQATNNGRWGIHDLSFLGNTWVAPSCEGNGIDATQNGGDYAIGADPQHQVGVNASLLIGPYCEGTGQASWFLGSSSILYPTGWGCPMVGTPQMISNGIGRLSLRTSDKSGMPAPLELYGRKGQSGQDVLTVRDENTNRQFGVDKNGTFGNAGSLGPDMPTRWSPATHDYEDGTTLPPNYAVFTFSNPRGSWQAGAIYAKQTAAEGGVAGLVFGTPYFEAPTGKWKFQDTFRLRAGKAEVWSGSAWKSLVLKP